MRSAVVATSESREGELNAGYFPRPADTKDHPGIVDKREINHLLGGHQVPVGLWRCLVRDRPLHLLVVTFASREGDEADHGYRCGSNGDPFPTPLLALLRLGLHQDLNLLVSAPGRVCAAGAFSLRCLQPSAFALLLP